MDLVHIDHFINFKDKNTGAISQNIFVYVPQKKESHRSLEQHENAHFWVNHPFNQTILNQNHDLCNTKHD